MGKVTFVPNLSCLFSTGTVVKLILYLPLSFLYVFFLSTMHVYICTSQNITNQNFISLPRSGVNSFFTKYQKWTFVVIMSKLKIDVKCDFYRCRRPVEGIRLWMSNLVNFFSSHVTNVDIRYRVECYGCRHP